MFSEIVSGGSTSRSLPPRESERSKLDEFHHVTQQAFLDEIARVAPKSKVPATKNFIQLSYAIRTQSGQQLPADRLLGVIAQTNASVRDTIRYGWSMFYPFTRPEIRAHFTNDQRLDNGETEFVQCSLIELGETDHLDFWRFAPDGRASIARIFNEDRPSKRPEGVAAQQKWFAPRLQVRDVTEIVRHARALSEAFPDVVEVCFKVEWKGLKDRITADWNHDWRPNGSQTDSRIVSACFPLAEIIGNLPAVVTSLYAPVHRLFDPTFGPTPEWVLRQMSDFIVPGVRD
jgi:hypothetical protein